MVPTTRQTAIEKKGRRLAAAFALMLTASTTVGVTKQSLTSTVNGHTYVYKPPRPIDEKLIAAVRAENIAQIKSLLKKGASANANEADGWHVLLIAVESRKHALEMAKLLLDHGADVNYRQPGQGFTAL